MVRTLSVVIPTLNDATLAETLQSVHRQTRRADEVIVVGRYAPSLPPAFPEVTFIDSGVPVCAAAARNRGILASSGEIIAFTDADCLPDVSWLEQHEGAHAAGARVVGGGVTLHSDNYWTHCDNLAMFHEFVSEHAPGDRRLLPTLNLSVRREVIDAVGVMDESFPGAAAEDTDWTVRMRLAGERLVFVPGAVVHHAPPRTRWRDVVRHCWNSGYAGIRVRHRYAEDYATPRFARNALLLRFLSPFIAARVTARIYASPLFWRHWRCLPVVYATKVIYCFGAAASVASGFAFDSHDVAKS